MAEPQRPVIALEQVPSQHPKVRFQLSEADLDAPNGCKLYGLVQLPPALFVDPYELPPHRSIRSPAKKAVEEAYARVNHVHIDGKTELEKAVGWTDPESKRRKISSRRAPHAGRDLAHSHALSVEHSLALFELELVDPPSQYDYNFTDTMDKLLKEHKALKTLKKPKTAAQLIRTYDLEIPLHARYLPPVAHHHGISAASALPDPKAIWQHLTDANQKHQEQVTLPAPKIFYSCQGPVSKEEGFKMGWQYAQPSELLDEAWANIRLDPPLAPFSTDPQVHRLLVPAPSATDVAGAHWTLPLPRGDASLTTFTQLGTAATVLLASLYAFIAISSRLGKVHRSERALQKLSEAKS